MKAKAFLFDMDGTLVDSHAVVEGMWRVWAARNGVDAELLLAHSHGLRARETMRRFAPPGHDLQAEMPWFAKEFSRHLGKLRAVPGAREFLAQIPAGKWALVTSADRATAREAMRAVGLPVPDVLVGADDVALSKPHPEGYLLAASRLGVTPDETLVFEDSTAGIAAGRAAGARVVTIGTLRARAPDDEFWAADFSKLAAHVSEGGWLGVAARP